MTESRILRTLALPLGVAVLFLLMTPKLCSRAIVQGLAHRSAPPSTPAVASPAGLIINDSMPAPAAPTHYPDGLDADRIQYLIEIDQTFAAPNTAAVTGGPLANELLARGYVEKRPDGTYGPTRDGLMNVNGATESSDGWIVPLAKRKFLGVMKVVDNGDGRVDVSAAWRWEPTAVGATLIRHPETRTLSVEFAGGHGHWVIDHWIDKPGWELY